MTNDDAFQSAYIPSLRLPRPVAGALWWGGGCSDVKRWGGRFLDEPIHRHQYCSCYWLLGAEKTMMVETGHGAQWPVIEAQIEQVLGDRRLDYVFPSHQEIPHAGNLGRILAKYPDAVAVGDVSDYHLYFPGIDRDRLVDNVPGDRIELGDRTVEFLEPVWSDLSTTLWAFEWTDRVLFSVDVMEYSHLDGPLSCGLMSDEIELPSDEIRKLLVFLLQPGARDTPMEPGLRRLRELFSALRPRVVAGSHAAPIRDNLEVFIPWILEEYAATGSDSGRLGGVRAEWSELLASLAG